VTENFEGKNNIRVMLEFNGKKFFFGILVEGWRLESDRFLYWVNFSIENLREFQGKDILLRD
jgi:hypothetical protein